MQVCYILVGLRLLIRELGVLAAQLLVVGIDRARELRYVDEERNLLHISLAIVGELHGDISARHAHTAILLDVAAFKRHLEMVGELRHPCARASLLVNDACDRLGAYVLSTTVDIDLCGLARVDWHNAIGCRVEHHWSVLDDELHGILTVGAIGAILSGLAIVAGVALDVNPLVLTPVGRVLLVGINERANIGVGCTLRIGGGKPRTIGILHPCCMDVVLGSRFAIFTLDLTHIGKAIVVGRILRRSPCVNP